MKNRFNPIVTATMILLDLLILILCFIYTLMVEYRFLSDEFTFEFLGFLFYINFIWIAIAVSFRPYISYRMKQIRLLAPAFLSLVIFFFFFLLYFQVVSVNYLNREEVKYYFMVFSILMIAVKPAEHFLLPHPVRLISKSLEAIIVGYSISARELADFFEQDIWSNYRFMGYFYRPAQPQYAHSWRLFRTERLPLKGTN
ncbi:MAG: hypothetical protein K9H16_05970 [Bacteroidales bacterium]|nr:hypothetical protein [Bacteroidales bacterium]